MATIEDVAKRAGVSTMTVSRFINESGYVGEKTRARILEAINELNYRTNLIAKSLVTKRTKTLGLVIASIVNPFYPDVVLGVEDESYANGYNVILCNAGGKKKEEEYIQVLLDKYVDGIIFDHLNIGIKQVMELKHSNVNCVLIDNEVEGLSAGNILTDNVLGGFLAVEHLIRLGHKKIAVIHGSLCFNESKPDKKYEETFQFNIWNKRTKGAIEAFEKYGVRVNPNFVLEGDGTSENGVKGGYMAMKRILEFAERPTAIYAQNDLMAVGVINAVHEAGLKVPADFSVIGHDGIPLGEMIFPKLTTIGQPRYEIGRAAAKMLIEMNEKNNSHINMVLKPRLVIRETTCEITKEQAEH